MHKDLFIVLAGTLLFITSYLFFMWYEQGVFWDSFYYLKDYCILIMLFLYGYISASTPIAKVVSLFSAIFVLFKGSYEMLVFWEYIILNEEDSVNALYFMYGATLWVSAVVYALKTKRKKK